MDRHVVFRLASVTPCKSGLVKTSLSHNFFVFTGRKWTTMLPDFAIILVTSSIKGHFKHQLLSRIWHRIYTCCMATSKEKDVNPNSAAIQKYLEHTESLNFKDWIIRTTSMRTISGHFPSSAKYISQPPRIGPWIRGFPSNPGISNTFRKVSIQEFW